MRERPIIFNSEMVRAILEGRKTQTRRPACKYLKLPNDFRLLGTFVDSKDILQAQWAGPYYRQQASLYGKPGDRLWVRETWAKTDNINSQDNWPGRPHKSLDSEGFQVVIYGADGSWLWCDGNGYSTEKSHWKPSIHMPRWASRITLEITNVRVERVESISQKDIQAEGFSKLSKDNGQTWKYGIPESDGLPGPAGWQWQDWNTDPIKSFQKLWDSIYEAKGLGWDANPWVWVYEFRRVE